MASHTGTLTLQKDQDYSPVRYNTQKAIQRESTQILRIHLWIHVQAPIAYQGNTGKLHPNGNSTRKIRLGQKTGVTASKVPIPTQEHNDQEVIQICNNLF